MIHYKLAGKANRTPPLPQRINLASDIFKMEKKITSMLYS